MSTSAHEHPSPTPYLPRVRAFEVHDLPFTPYFYNFMTTRVLEFGWTTDFAPLVSKPILKPLLTLLGKKKLYEERFGDNKNATLCFADSIAQLLFECSEEIMQKKKSNKKNANNTFRILDMCTGAGGPSFRAAEKLAQLFYFNSSSLPAISKPRVHSTVSDIVPHPKHWQERTGNHRQVNLTMDYTEESVDASKVQSGVAKNAIWTIHGAFHHFEEDLALKILKSATENDDCSGILIVELAEHRLSTCLLLLPAGVLLTLLLPFYVIQPWSKIPENLVFFIKVLFFLPLLCLTMMWDSTISCSRTMTTQEMLKLAKRADPEGKMEWHSAVRDFVPGLPDILAPGIVYVRGIKK